MRVLSTAFLLFLAVLVSVEAIGYPSHHRRTHPPPAADEYPLPGNNEYDKPNSLNEGQYPGEEAEYKLKELPEEAKKHRTHRPPYNQELHHTHHP